MKPALHDLQAAFAAHVLGHDRVDVVASVTGDSIPAAARLRIYRHHVFHSLATALGATYPTVQALVGEGFFRRMAHDFVTANLPSQPVLAEYGAGFADFVRDYAPARDLAYLADIARLDWALNVAFHAPFEPRLGAADLAEIPPERLVALPMRLASGMAVIASRHAIDRIWEASQPGTSLESVDAGGAAFMLVLRRPDDAGLVPVSEGEAMFLMALGEGASLGDAAEEALVAEEAFDLTAAFARFLSLGVFAAAQHER